MTARIQVGGLKIATGLWQLVDERMLSGIGIKSKDFWSTFEKIVDDLTPINKALLEKRAHLQSQIDDWHLAHVGQAHDPDSYKAFLQEIGYLLPEGDDFYIETTHIDSEITDQAGPQLVVPVKNARFALNAANARWGSLYDALYGTDAISDAGGAEKGAIYNPVRGQKVIQFAKQHLDIVAPLEDKSHANGVRYFIDEGMLQLELNDGCITALVDPDKFVGYTGEWHAPSSILLKNNGLHVEIQIDSQDKIGQVDAAHVKDLLVEAAVTTIMDCEDSIAAVDSEDKIEVYRNWLGLMQGVLSETIVKNEQATIRTLADDRHYTAANGEVIILPGRSLLFVRNVGHFMTTDAVLNQDNEAIHEGILDGMITTLAAMHDLKGLHNGRANSRAGSVNIVKPKMHGPEEVAFTCELFNRIEDALQLERYTIKLGIMDEERRTTVNLKACIREAKHRVVFINTGFLDRTGDEIHTSMLAGPMVPKAEMKQSKWLKAYEDWNVDMGLACGLQGHAQIGKGMWAMPDEMAAMLAEKIAHPRAGANTAWVPSPNAAILHSTHYHLIDVKAYQNSIKQRARASIDDLLTLPLMQAPQGLTQEAIHKELDNNAQGILGYVVRWVDQGIGCSKVLDMNNVGLMEDRATLRISSQHIANWLVHGICTEEQVLLALKRMALIVDEQNSGDPLYDAMGPHFDGLAFKAACALIFEGKSQPSGYTEPLLHQYRIEAKARMN
ncbi:malate synthase G [Shewanella surugensis]|uniref:Malate synthase G n=1 Tax=Shewanella surugensis TaxID=212020 RepID=A0ABT0L702_9GAMM|nr:malate synthase G [Shewanella surugensis]MCL1123481.1 malate synthase G [Shewanella surugensis]